MTYEALPFPRSWLPVDGDPARALESQADCILLSPESLNRARENRSQKPPRRFLHILNGADESAILHEMLRLAVACDLEGIFLSGRMNGADLQRIDVLLSACEATEGRQPGCTAIAAMPAEDAPSAMTLGGFAGKSRRLAALGGGGDGIIQSLGLKTGDAEPLRLVRGMTVLAAAGAGVPALAGPSSGLSPEAFAAACRRDRADGFAGKLVCTPDEAIIANGIFA
ncbi:hypothetical protein NOF55_11475 [Rhizobiaceae bacterium BDR2-2]|uniref:HpcH/HpaI aldolase/citrate lyase domain-containing protein n=1 Tax=Ectorhizobium quercum TaxID=2965071 RepID=A0AAE3N0A0_9HYPH|nr:hypothetical protein [Ectorhizobium quercum]MCX8997721.1 hypothetical protein [Ectorhizobium quercum]